MSLTSILLGLGIGLLIFILIIIAIQIILFILLFKSIKKHPAFWVMVLIILIVISTIELLDPATIAVGIVSWAALITTIIAQYKKIKKSFRKSKKRR